MKESRVTILDDNIYFINKPRTLNEMEISVVPKKINDLVLQFNNDPKWEIIDLLIETKGGQTLTYKEIFDNYYLK